MILVFGGAYQGKLEYVKANFGQGNPTIWDCSDGKAPDFEADIICGIEGYMLESARKGLNGGDIFKSNEELLHDKILIMTDVSQGVVPVDKDVRAFREMNGRLMLYLASKAERIIRVFCGIGKDLK